MIYIALALGFLTLVLGAVKDFGGYTNEIAAAIGAIVVWLSAAKEWIGLRKDLAPILARKTLPVSVVAPVDQLDAAGQFAARLIDLGYASTNFAGRPEHASARVVVLYHPGDEAADLVSTVLAHNPGARILIYSFTRVDVRLSDTITCANSTGRLLLDLGAEAEIASVRGGAL